MAQVSDSGGATKRKVSISDLARGKSTPKVGPPTPPKRSSFDDLQEMLYTPKVTTTKKAVSTVTKPKTSAAKPAAKKTPSYTTTMAKVYAKQGASNRAKTLGVKPIATDAAPRSTRKVAATVTPQAGLSAMRQVNAPVAPPIAAPSYTGMAGVTRGAGPGAATIARARSLASNSPTYTPASTPSYGLATAAPAAAIPPMAPLLRGMAQSVAPLVGALSQKLPTYKPLETLAQNWRVGDNIQRLLAGVGGGATQLPAVPQMAVSGINALQNAGLLAPAAAAASSVMPWLRVEGAPEPAGAQNPLAMNAASGTPLNAIGALIAQALTRQQPSGVQAPIPSGALAGPPSPVVSPLTSVDRARGNTGYAGAPVTGVFQPNPLGAVASVSPTPESTTPPRAIMPGGDSGGDYTGTEYPSSSRGYDGGYSYTPYRSSGYTPYSSRGYYSSGYTPYRRYYASSGGGGSSGGRSGYVAASSGGSSGGTATGTSTGGTTTAETGWGGLPAEYIKAFTQAFNMAPEAYYTAAMGGSDQAAKDYQNFIGMWQNRTNRPMTPAEVSQVLLGFDAYTAILGRNPTMSDLINYLNLILAQPETPEGVSYLKMAEI